MIVCLSLWRGEIICPPPPPGPKSLMREIIAEVAEETGVTVGQLMGSTKTQFVTNARHLAWAAIYATGRFSYPQIGQFFGRNHTTVRSGCLQVAERRGLLWRGANDACGR